jgi:C-terminal processing protease CtpA/Prc
MDELSGSGGDAFPALIGGYGRAKLIGTRTMGAGGHVESLTPLANSQIKVDITRSLFYRPDGVAVENNGAIPDIEYKTTINDFKYGHQEYQKFFTEKIMELVPTPLAREKF